MLKTDGYHIQNLLYTNIHTKLWWPDDLLLVWCWCSNVLLCTVTDACVTHTDTQRKLFVCWFIQWENISKMSSFSWACMIHSGLLDLWMSLWFTVQISSAGKAARMLERWHGQECNSFCQLRNRRFILIQCSNPHLLSCCRKSVNLSSAEGKWDYFISMRHGWFPSVDLKANMTFTNFSL